VQRAKESSPFAITLDIMMPEKDGWQVMRDLKNDPETRDIPIVICSILENQEQGFSMGATDYLVKPFLQDDMINTINRINCDGLIQEILVIDDSPEDLRLVQKMLDGKSAVPFRVTTGAGRKQGLGIDQNQAPDAIILDLFMPDMNGFTILEKLRIDPACAIFR
jgi:CheY-like chemotaxis protein